MCMVSLTAARTWVRGQRGSVQRFGVQTEPIWRGQICMSSSSKTLRDVKGLPDVTYLCVWGWTYDPWRVDHEHLQISGKGLPDPMSQRKVNWLCVHGLISSAKCSTWDIRGTYNVNWMNGCMNAQHLWAHSLLKAVGKDATSQRCPSNSGFRSLLSSQSFLHPSPSSVQE